MPLNGCWKVIFRHSWVIFTFGEVNNFAQKHKPPQLIPSYFSSWKGPQNLIEIVAHQQILCLNFRKQWEFDGLLTVSLWEDINYFTCIYNPQQLTPFYLYPPKNHLRIWQNGSSTNRIYPEISKNGESLSMSCPYLHGRFWINPNTHTPPQLTPLYLFPWKKYLRI